MALESLETRNMLSTSPIALHIADGVDLSAAEVAQAEGAQAHLANAKFTEYLHQDGSGLIVLDVTTATSGLTTTTFQQTFQELPIYGSMVSVVQDSTGDLQEVYNHTWNNVNGGELPTNLLSPSKAIQIAEDSFAFGGLPSSANQVWFATGRDLTRAWQVNTGETVLDAGFSRYVSVIDAANGDVLVHDKLDSNYLGHFASDTGVFPRIVVNNAMGIQGARNYAAPFDAVAALSQGCSGTLIAPDLVIAARHCGSGSQVRFGDNENSPSYIASVQSTTYPAGGGSLLDGGDVSLVRLTQNVPSGIATPMRLIDEGDALEGQVAATIGYGYNGLGSSGHGFSADGFRWGGENIIDAYGSPVAASGTNIFSTDFDNGSSGANTIPGSDPTPLVFEATTAPGDSGGPLLVESNGEWLIAGVLSGGTTSTSVYGDISWWTGVTPFRDQIEQAGGEFLGGGFGTIALDKGVYNTNDTIEVSVRDPNAVLPLQVTITSSSGDSETVTLSNTFGSNYSATISTSAGAASTNDGSLQVALGNSITATYQDPDDGMGNPNTATANALVANVMQFSSTDVPIGIVDLQTRFSDLDVTDTGTILDIDVQIDITHTWNEDLNVFVNAPDGTRVELFSDVGGNSNNFDNTILDDEASTSIASGSGPFAGTFAPFGDLSDFDGMDVMGTWRLEIFDDFSADQGTLHGWSIHVVLESTTVSGDFNGDGSYDCADANDLLAEIAAGTHNTAYDLTGDGAVDLADRDAWLLEAGEANLGPGRSYLLGDANLDGNVDGDDFITWNNNKFTNVTGWCNADFDGDGQASGTDFLLWNANKFQSAIVQPTLPSTAVTTDQQAPTAVRPAAFAAFAGEGGVVSKANQSPVASHQHGRDAVFAVYADVAQSDTETDDETEQIEKLFAIPMFA